MIANPFLTSDRESPRMSTLRRQDPTGQGLKRIACAQVEAAIRCLTREAGQALSAADAIDLAQAVLCLIEPELPRHALRKERAILSRLRSGLAEMTEPTRLLEQLNKRYKKTPSESDLASAVKALRKRWSSRDQSAAALSSKAGSFNPAIYRLVADMAELRGHMDHWPVDGVPDDAPPRGLRRTYTKARRLAGEPMTVDSLAVLVDVLAELIVQINVLSKACPPMLKAQRKLLSRGTAALTEVLNDEQLNKALSSELGKAASKVLDQEPLPGRVAGVLASEIEPALAESPAAFTNRLKAYWSAWRGEVLQR
jgi:hypothetical protein